MEVKRLKMDQDKQKYGERNLKHGGGEGMNLY